MAKELGPTPSRGVVRIRNQGDDRGGPWGEVLNHVRTAGRSRLLGEVIGGRPVLGLDARESRLRYHRHGRAEDQVWRVDPAGHVGRQSAGAALVGAEVPDQGCAVLDFLRRDVVEAELAGGAHVRIADRVDRELDVVGRQRRAVRPLQATLQLDGDVHVTVVDLLDHAVVRGRYVSDQVRNRLVLRVEPPQQREDRSGQHLLGGLGGARQDVQVLDRLPVGVDQLPSLGAFRRVVVGCQGLGRTPRATASAGSQQETPDDTPGESETRSLPPSRLRYFHSFPP